MDLDGHKSPVKFENTYNSHSFVARMSHDQTLVARIEVDHDVVRNCPDPKRRRSSGDGARIEVLVEENSLVEARSSSNVTKSLHTSSRSLSSSESNSKWLSAKANVTGAARALPDVVDALSYNSTGIMMFASMIMAS